MTNKLPETEEEWEATPRPVSLVPDAQDLYIASHSCLKPCPFCGGQALAMGQHNRQSGLYGYRIQCTDYHCHGNVFTCDHTRDGARDQAIKQWSRRTAGESGEPGKADWRIGLKVKTKFGGDRWQGISGEVVEVMETGSCGLIDASGILVVRLGNGETIVSGADRWMTASGN